MWNHQYGKSKKNFDRIISCYKLTLLNYDRWDEDDNNNWQSKVTNISDYIDCNFPSYFNSVAYMNILLPIGNGNKKWQTNSLMCNLSLTNWEIEMENEFW